MKPARISEILCDAYRWLPSDDAKSLGSVLAVALEGQSETRARASICACTLTNWGLPVTGDLLLSLVGGSKTMISAVMRETYIINAQRAAANSSTNNDPRHSAALRSEQSNGGLEQVYEKLGTLSTNVDYLLGQLSWIQRSIDTERQLSKLLSERAVVPLQAQETAPQTKQRVIGTLLDDMRRAQNNPGAQLHSAVLPLDPDIVE